MKREIEEDPFKKSDDLDALLLPSQKDMIN